MAFPGLVRSRWQLNEFVYLEYRRGLGVLLDVGPFPHNPDDQETDKAYGYLMDSHLDFLTLSDTEWRLDLPGLAAQFPALKIENLTGTLSHPPAFETTSILLPRPNRFYTNEISPAAEGVYFLRVQFLPADANPEPAIIFPMDDSDAMAADSSLEEKEEGKSSDAERASPFENPVDDNEFCFYTKLTVEACLQKLKTYVPLSSGSSVIQMPAHPFEYTATLFGNSFTVKNILDANTPAHYRAYFSGALRTESDGGAVIMGDYGVEAADPLRSFLPYAGLLLSAALGLMGFNSMSSSMMLCAGYFSFAAFCLFGVVRFLTHNDRERRAICDQKKNPLIDFIQKALEAEAVEQKGS